MIKNLKTLRKEKGVSQKALGEEIGVSQQSINKYENYNIEPDISTLIHLSKYFNTSVDYLIGNTEIRQATDLAVSFDFTNDEMELINQYRVLSPEEKKSILMFLNKYNH